MAGNPFAALLAAVKSDVNARLSGFLDAKIDAIRLQAPEARDVMRELVQLCRRGGKRTRPALAVVGYLATRASDDWEAALDVGVALELLHAYFLIHDDWMDRDHVRRGAPTVHTTLARRFRSEHLGAAGAILAGDYAAALALEALCRVEVPAGVFTRLLQCFSEMQQAAVLGQELDVLGARGSVEHTYQLKTGSYSVRGPLLLGAILADADRDQCGALERFAAPAGVAFQLRDDLLNAFGNARTTGKPVGSDIQEGKRTLLAQVALRRLNTADRKHFLAAFGRPKATPKQIVRAIALLQASGARAHTEARIAELLTEALRAIESAPFQARGKELLRGAAEFLIRREH